jgi:hypothetical protein
MVAERGINRKIQREADRVSGLVRGGKKPGPRVSLPATLFQTTTQATQNPYDIVPSDEVGDYEFIDDIYTEEANP